MDDMLEGLNCSGAAGLLCMNPMAVWWECDEIALSTPSISWVVVLRGLIYVHDISRFLCRSKYISFLCFISVYLLPFNSRGFLLPKEASCVCRFLLLTHGDAGSEVMRQSWNTKGTQVHTYSVHEAWYCAEMCGGTAQARSGCVT